MKKLNCIICNSCRIVLDANPPNKSEKYFSKGDIHICKKKCSSEYSGKDDLSWKQLKKIIDEK